MTPRITQCDDGSLLIEWIRQGERLGFSLEVNMDGSGWYHVSTDGTNDSGELTSAQKELFFDFFAKELGIRRG